jgi:hypothetical protein
MEHDRDGTLETVVGAAGVLTAGGVLTFALFPLLLPTVVLLGVLAVPLLPLLLLGLVAWPLFMLARGMGRRLRRRPRPKAAETEAHRVAGPVTPAGVRH